MSAETYAANVKAAAEQTLAARHERMAEAMARAWAAPWDDLAECNRDRWRHLARVADAARGA